MGISRMRKPRQPSVVLPSKSSFQPSFVRPWRAYWARRIESGRDIPAGCAYRLEPQASIKNLGRFGLELQCAASQRHQFAVYFPPRAGGRQVHFAVHDMQRRLAEYYQFDVVPFTN